MKLSYFPNYAAKNAAPVLESFLRGAALHGITVERESYTADAVLIWSQLWAGRMRKNFDVYQHYSKIGKPIIIIDVGAISRNVTWRISLQGDPFLAGKGHNSQRRSLLGLEYQDWKTSGHSILVALQRPDSNQWAGQPDLDQWCHDVVRNIRQHTDRAIRIRTHPRFPIKLSNLDAHIQAPTKIANTYDDYDFVTQLTNAWAVVNWNSSPGIISVLHGVPAFVSPTSLAADVANQDWSLIETPARPDREQWANDLAWSEWTREEMAAGIPQQFILEKLQGQ